MKLQVGIKGIDTRGKENRVRISNEMEGKLKIQIEDKAVWIEDTDLLRALNDLFAPAEGKHVRHG